ncbi:hypothetical protein STENM327S_06936 [Streptomyces tendae]
MTLSACGSDDSPGKGEGEDKIAGADRGSKPSASPSPSETTAGDRPVISFPSDAKNVFEGGKTGNAKKYAVLADSSLAVNAVMKPF